jgi:Heterokaryon incompatibility protein (HET)
MSNQATTDLDGTVSETSNGEDTLFEYSQIPLSSAHESIRLVYLEPGTGDDQLVCSIRAIDLESQTASYEALSYCWGSAKKLHTIICNGRRLKITTSLFHGLRCLRLVNDVRAFWVDAISINQNDVDEKSHQVSIMATIYSKALRTVIWLGEATESSRLAFDFVYRLVEASKTVPDPTGFLKSPELYSVCLGMSDVGVVFGLPASLPLMRLIRQPRCAALSELLLRPWFERIWVVQEFFCASNRLVVCGSDVIPWEELAGAIKYALSIGLQLNEHIVPPGHQASILLFGTTTLSTVQSMPLLRVLQNFHRWKATDARDKVYAMYGMAHLNDGHLKKLGSEFIRMNVRPDYRVVTSELYRNIAYKICCHDRNLDMLSVASFGPPSSQNLPSWVPDWSQVHPQSWVLNDFSHRFQAASEAPSAPIVQGDVLTLQGYVVDSLVRVGLPNNTTQEMTGDFKRDVGKAFLSHRIFSMFLELSRSDEDELTMDRVRSILPDLIDSFRVYISGFVTSIQRSRDWTRRVIDWETIAFKSGLDRSSTYESKLDVYLQTITCNSDPWTLGLKLKVRNWYWKNQRLPSSIHMFYKYVVIGNGYFLLLYLPVIILLTAFHIYIESYTYQPNIDDMLDDMDFTNGRRLARTAKGHLSLVPERAEVGDDVALLAGGKVPFIIRRKEEHQWRLIGDVYVYGIMKGKEFKKELCNEIMLV